MTLTLTAVAITTASAVATYAVVRLAWRSDMRQIADILGSQSEES